MRRAALVKLVCALAVLLTAAVPRPFADACTARWDSTRRAEAYAGTHDAPPAWHELDEFASPLRRAALLAQGAPRVRTDRGVYVEPPLPARLAAGGKYVDAVFGTEIMRATDERDHPAPGCGTWYNQWPTFNADNTRLLIRCGVDGGVLIKSFDPATFTLGRTLRNSPMLPGNVTVEWQGAMWSRTDPDLIYVHVNGYSRDYPSTGMKLYTYKPSTNAFKLVRDFAPELARGQPDFLFEMHVDAKDDVFTFMHKRVGTGGEPLYFIAWSRLRDKVLAHVDNRTLDANMCLPDKSGRYLYFGLNKVQPDKSKAKILDLETNRWETLYWTPSDDPPSHGDLGTGFVVGRSPWTAGVTRRPLAAPHSFIKLFDMKDARGKQDWSNDQHMTLYADNEDWVLLATYDDPSAPAGTDTGAYEDEIMQIATDESGRIRRLLHTRSLYDNKTETSGYWASPKATISRDGRFVAYTSNWEGSGRTDLFIARIESAPAPAVSAPSPAPTTRPRRAIGGANPAPMTRRTPRR